MSKDKETVTDEKNLAIVFADYIGRMARGECDIPEMRATIERYCLWRPLGDDDEPVQLGDTVIDKVRGEMLVTRMCHVGKGVYFNESHNRWGKKLRTSRIAYAPGERVRRPESRVLDADGVPIEVGDTVYRVDDGLKMTVVATGEEAHKHCCEVLTVEYGDNPHSIGKLHYSAKELTHRELDSFEKLLSDMRNQCKAGFTYINDIQGYTKRLTALMRLDGRDA